MTEFDPDAPSRLGKSLLQSDAVCIRFILFFLRNNTSWWLRTPWISLDRNTSELFSGACMITSGGETFLVPLTFVANVTSHGGLPHSGAFSGGKIQFSVSGFPRAILVDPL